MPDAFHVTSGSPGSNGRLVGTAGLHTVTVDAEFAVHQITQHDAVAAVEAENAVFALGGHPHQDSLDRAALPDIHMIVPGGGIAPDGRWISSRPAFLLPVRVLGALFRRLFLTRLLALRDAGRLAFFGKLAGLADRRAFLRYLSPVRKKRSVVYAKPPFAGPEAVLAYLSRYT